MNPLLAGDPLFSHGIDTEVVIIVIVKTILIFAILLVSVLFYVVFLRKVIADMQNRIGPQRAGPFGTLQSLADGIKLFFKEQSIPDSADRPVFRLAPYLSALRGIDCSLKNSLMPSARVWRIPNGPALSGPIRFCMSAITLRRNQM